MTQEDRFNSAMYAMMEPHVLRLWKANSPEVIAYFLTEHYRTPVNAKLVCSIYQRASRLDREQKRGR